MKINYVNYGGLRPQELFRDLFGLPWSIGFQLQEEHALCRSWACHTYPSHGLKIGPRIIQLCIKLNTKTFGHTAVM